MTRFSPLNSIQTLVVIGVVVVSALTLLKGRRRTVRDVRLLPGPIPLPIIGNCLSIDLKKPWVTYADWATRYGDIFRVRVLRQDIIVINSKKIAKDLLDCRSSIYSDRPHIATRDPFGWSFNFGWASYGDQWRSQRRLFHQAFRPEASLAFHPVQLRKARHLVLDILGTPQDFSKHIRKFSAAVIMSIVYDYEVAPEHDYLVELFERGNELALESLTPEASSFLDAFPFVLSLPEWFPGVALRHKAAISKHCATQMVEEPFQHAMKRKAMGSSVSAMALDLLGASKDTDDPLQLQLLKDTCATAFVAGAETSASMLQWFMLTMLKYPQVQEQAQAEIDAVVGTDRLPNFDDRPNLPYVEAILLETLRMYPVAPLGLPHATTTDDIYEGFFIPKGDNVMKIEEYPLTLLPLHALGSTVVANIWTIYRDGDLFPDPNVFKPERFFVDGRLSGEKSTDSLTFGFGRRTCPGRHMADNSIWAGMVSVLYAFKISKAHDEHGQELEFEPSFGHGVTTAPDPFPCRIMPRSSTIHLRKLSVAEL